ncbi:MAG: DUF1549 domain-containing protein, partial [Verrucomicrobiota bacterium]
MTNPSEPPALRPPPLQTTPRSPRFSFVVCALALLALTTTIASFWKKPAPPGPESFDPHTFTSPAFTATISEINNHFAERWNTADITPVDLAPPLTVARRLSLALTGTIPSLEEVRALESIPEDYRTQWWLSRLFEDPRYADFIAERFARALVGVENGPFLVYRRHRLVEWLADQFHENRPYDDLVRTLITAEGIWTNQPEVNFISVSVI